LVHRGAKRFADSDFDTFGLQAWEPFRLRGKQIDGSFQLQGETYLFEAKWHLAQALAADLHAFHGKVERKAAWARWPFIRAASRPMAW